MTRASIVAVPVIETQRLRLRGHRFDDLGDCVSLWSNPAVTRFIGGKPSTEQQTWARLLAYIGHWSILGFGYWVIEEKDTKHFVGEIGFADFKRDIDASMRGVPEIGFALAPAYHGRGYATEGVQAVLAWGDTNLPSRRTVCMINPQNLASVRVVQKFGYEIFTQTEFSDQPILFLEREAHDDAAPE